MRSSCLAFDSGSVLIVGYSVVSADPRYRGGHCGDLMYNRILRTGQSLRVPGWDVVLMLGGGRGTGVHFAQSPIVAVLIRTQGGLGSPYCLYRPNRCSGRFTVQFVRFVLVVRAHWTFSSENPRVGIESCSSAVGSSDHGFILVVEVVFRA